MARCGAGADREGVDVAQDTTVRCPHCDHDSHFGITLTNLTVVGAAMNVAVTCTHCGQVFDATGGGDGTFSTVGGRLQRVSDAVRAVQASVAHLTPEELRDLRDYVAGDPAPAALPDSLLAVPGLESWAKQHPALWGLLLAVLTVILTAKVNPTPTSPLPPPSVIEKSDPEIDELVRQQAKLLGLLSQDLERRSQEPSLRRRQRRQAEPDARRGQ